MKGNSEMKKLTIGLLTALVLGGLALAVRPVLASDKADSCCCIQQEGKLVCTITGQALEKGCCE